MMERFRLIQINGCRGEALLNIGLKYFTFNTFHSLSSHLVFKVLGDFLKNVKDHTVLLSLALPGA